MIKPPASTSASLAAAGPRKITIVIHWLDELMKRAPVKRKLFGKFLLGRRGTVASVSQGRLWGTLVTVPPSVPFEMLTGKSIFAGDDVSQTLARALERQPDFSSLPPNLHPKIIETLERCLEKDARGGNEGQLAVFPFPIISPFAI